MVSVVLSEGQERVFGYCCSVCTILCIGVGYRPSAFYSFVSQDLIERGCVNSIYRYTVTEFLVCLYNICTWRSDFWVCVRSQIFGVRESVLISVRHSRLLVCVDDYVPTFDLCPLILGALDLRCVPHSRCKWCELDFGVFLRAVANKAQPRSR